MIPARYSVETLKIVDDCHAEEVLMNKEDDSESPCSEPIDPTPPTERSAPPPIKIIFHPRVGSMVLDVEKEPKLIVSWNDEPTAGTY
jgi:hypothetical protein